MTNAPQYIQKSYTFSINFTIKERVLVPELEPDIIKLVEDDARHTYNELTRVINHASDYLIATISSINRLEPLEQDDTESMQEALKNEPTAPATIICPHCHKAVEEY